MISGQFRPRVAGRPQYRFQQGFTLLELAIVFGLTSLIIAGVFSASTMVRYHNLINEASDQLARTANNVRSYYAGRAGPSGLATCSVTAPTFATTFPTAVFPFEMVNGAVVNNPWNLNSTTSTVYVDFCTSVNTQIVIRYTGIPADACSDLIVHNSLPGRDTGLTMIVVNPTALAMPIVGQVSAGATATPLPVAPIDATNACAGASNTVQWYYTLNN